MPTNIVSFFCPDLVAVLFSCISRGGQADGDFVVRFSDFLGFRRSLVSRRGGAGVPLASGYGVSGLPTFVLAQDTTFPASRSLFWCRIRRFRRPEVCFGAGYDVSSVLKFILLLDTTFPASKCLVRLNIRHFQRLAVCFGPGYGVSSVPRCRLLRDTASVGRNGRRGGACRQSADCFTPIIYRGQRTQASRVGDRRRVRLQDDRGKSTDRGEKVW